jgi:hypothetical protein
MPAAIPLAARPPPAAPTCGSPTMVALKSISAAEAASAIMKAADPLGLLGHSSSTPTLRMLKVSVAAGRYVALVEGAGPDRLAINIARRALQPY